MSSFFQGQTPKSDPAIKPTIIDIVMDKLILAAEKYNINEYQGDLFKRKNKPNPIFYNELKNLLKHFMWNWEDYLEKNKLRF